MTINFTTNKARIKRIAIEDALLGTSLKRKYYVAVIVFLLMCLSGIGSGGKQAIALIVYDFVLLILPIFRALIIGNKVYKSFTEKEIKSTYVIEDNKISFETYCENELKDSGIYNFEDIKDILSVKKYSFVHFKNGKSVFIDNDSFIDGSIRDFKRDFSRFKEARRTCEKVKSDAEEKRRIYGTKGFKIACIAVFVVSILFACLSNIAASESGDEFCFLGVYCLAVVFLLTQIFGVVSYIVWFKKQATTAKVLSIVFFSLTYIIIDFVGCFNIILFLCDKVKMLFTRMRRRKGTIQ